MLSIRPQESNFFEDSFEEWDTDDEEREASDFWESYGSGGEAPSVRRAAKARGLQIWVHSPPPPLNFQQSRGRARLTGEGSRVSYCLCTLWGAGVGVEHASSFV